MCVCVCVCAHMRVCESPVCMCVYDHKYIDPYEVVTRYRPIVNRLFINNYYVHLLC